MNLSVKRLFDMIIVWKNWKPGKLNGKDTGLYLDCSNAPRWSKLCIACSDFFATVRVHLYYGSLLQPGSGFAQFRVGILLFYMSWTLR